MGLPPSDSGAVHDTCALESPATADTPPGAAGTLENALGVTGFEGLDAGPRPTAFVALTVNVYVVPFTRPDTEQLVPFAASSTHAAPPGDAVTV